MALNSISDVIERIARGEIVIVVDDEDRENEGDFIMAAEFCTPESVNFMITHGRGLVCMPCSPSIIEKLELQPMLTGDMVTVDTPFCVPIDHKGGTSGISAQDRALTVSSCAKEDTKPEDFHRPGHIFPLRASEDGVLARRGHTEATIDLARLAGCAPIGMLCEILNTDGTAARMDSLEQIAKEHNLAITSIELLAQYRQEMAKSEINLDEEDSELMLEHANV
ncbi:MAG: 3,4-dihydroxy-2-butanone-4-phosphate synthase [Acidimicrobiia bacterium]